MEDRLAQAGAVDPTSSAWIVQLPGAEPVPRSLARSTVWDCGSGSSVGVDRVPCCAWFCASTGMDG
jgi:hypothetical protein